MWPFTGPHYTFIGRWKRNRNTNNGRHSLLKLKKQKICIRSLKGLLETGLKRKNFNECLGDLILDKSLKDDKIDSRECLSLSEDEVNHDDSTY